MQIELCNIATKIGGVKFTVLNNVLAFRKVPRQIRRRYSVSKRLVKLTRFQDFPRSCLDIKIYLRYHLCWVINFNTLIACSSVQSQLKTASQWKDSIPYILTYSQFCKTSINCSRPNKAYSHKQQKQPFTWILSWILRVFLEHLFCIIYSNRI